MKKCMLLLIWLLVAQIAAMGQTIITLGNSDITLNTSSGGSTKMGVAYHPSYGNYYFSNSVPGNGAPLEPTFNWIDPVASGHTLVSTWTTGGQGDDDYFQIPDIGFDFYFFGTAYRTNNVYIGSNGYITFGDGNTDYVSYKLPDPFAPSNMIALAEADLDCSTSIYADAHVYYGGNANQFVITWVHAHAIGDATTYVSFQIILFPNGNASSNSTYINQYNDALSSALATNSIVHTCSIGLNNGDGSEGMNYRYNGTRGPMYTGIASPNGVNALSLGYGPNTGALPVELSSFSSNVSGRTVNLLWTTSSEINNSGFDIERQSSSSNNQFTEWTKIGFVKSLGTKNSLSRYNFQDNKLDVGKYNYRLKQIDVNGNYKYYTLNNSVQIGLPSNYNISQNYPNPFNPTTKIDYQLPADSKVTLIIYDMLGREMNKLVNETQKAGFYTVQFNAINFASGIYFYRMIANANNQNIVLTKKMSLIK